MIDLMSTAYLALIVVVAMFVLGFIFSRLYQRSSKERAFVRTGLGGQKVIMDGGALKLPVFHELIWVNMNTLKLEVHRSDQDSLFTKDRMRVDVVAAFFVRVIPTVEGISTAAQTLGQRTLDPEALKALVEDKFVDALRAASVSMTMQELLDKRQDFIQAVQNAVAEDLTFRTGVEVLINLDPNVVQTEVAEDGTMIERVGFEDVRFNWETNLRVNIVGNLLAELRFLMQFDNVPAAGAQKLDTITQLNLVYNIF